MANAYCGKNCDSCIQKERLECQGCRLGPGRSWYDGCEIAACCRDKGHDTCDTCTNNRYCGKRSRRDGMVEHRERKLAAEAERKAELARRAPFLGRWLWVLFWMVIPGTVASLLSIDAMAGWAPGVYRFGEYLSVACSLAYGLILLILASRHDVYRIAGILRLVTAAVSLVLVLAAGKNTGTGWTLLISLPGGVVGLVATYQEYMAHAAVLDSLDRTLAEKWRMLWKWYIGVFIATFGSVVVMLIFQLLGLLVLLAALIGMVVVSVLELVYLYQSAKEFRYYPYM